MRDRNEIESTLKEMDGFGSRREYAETVSDIGVELLLDLRDQNAKIIELLSRSNSPAQQALDASVERSTLRTVKRVADEVSRGS